MRRPCPQACTACICRAERRSRCGLPAVRPSRARTSDSLLSYSAPAIGARAPKTAPRRRRSRAAIASRSGRLSQRSRRLLGHDRARRAEVRRSADAVWAGMARHGRPIQYAYLDRAACLVGRMDADRRPSGRLRAAFCGLRARLEIPWRTASPRRGIRHLTLAAGISSTGDPALDARLPFDEPYRIPSAPLQPSAGQERKAAVSSPSERRSSARSSIRGGRAGEGVADQRIGPDTRLRVVDAILSGTHEPHESHYQCCVRSRTTTCSLGPRRRSKPRATARTSSAIRS